MRMLPKSIVTLFRRIATEKYPKVRPTLPQGFRGRPVHDSDCCIYCGLCEKYCPSGAIVVDKVKKTWTHDAGKCLFCAQCEETCHEMPKRDAIHMSQEFELASRSRKRLVKVSRKG
jgi:formate hydrogenlyase subunit 6